MAARALACALALAATGAVAQHAGHGAGQDGAARPYAGLETRAIAGLSADDVAELRVGGGWGLALPAELNGLPGPVHLLELAEALELTEAQVAAIRAIEAQMRAEAKLAGARLIAAEAALSDAFAAGGPTPEALRDLVAEAGAARAALRLVHLSRHLATPPLLTQAQMDRYAVLRGYAEDPCAAVPEGHDPAMWRRHNGCG